MKPGTRVKLTEQLEDLPAGSQGVVVIAKENCSDSGMLFPYTYTGKTIDVPAVLFDHMKNPAITRRKEDQIIQVVSKCIPV